MGKELTSAFSDLTSCVALGNVGRRGTSSDDMMMKEQIAFNFHKLFAIVITRSEFPNDLKRNNIAGQCGC